MSIKSKFLTIISILYINSMCYSQEFDAVATYSIQLAEDNQSFNAELRFTLSESLFLWKRRNLSKWVKEKNNDFGVQVVYTDTAGYYVKTRIGSNVIRLRQFCGENNPLILDDPIKHQWSLSNEETKTILGKVCRKATTKFRGRDYVAWYAVDIPVQAGPWKFHGLPGLIMQVKDIKKEVLISINSLDLKPDSQKIKLDKNQGKYVSRFELQNCLNRQWDKYYRKNQANIAKLQSEFPDLNISDNNLPKVRPATELE